MTQLRTRAGQGLLDLWIADTEVPQLDWLRLRDGIAAIEAEARADLASERKTRRITDKPASGRWRRVGWHYPRCWQTWLDGDGEAECICWGER